MNINQTSNNYYKHTIENQKKSLDIEDHYLDKCEARFKKRLGMNQKACLLMKLN